MEQMNCIYLISLSNTLCPINVITVLIQRQLSMVVHREVGLPLLCVHRAVVRADSCMERPQKLSGKLRLAGDQEEVVYESQEELRIGWFVERR